LSSSCYHIWSICCKFLLSFTLYLLRNTSIIQGVDFPNVKIVCNAGLPATGVDTLQRGGRAIRTGNGDALFVIFYDSWVNEIDLEEFLTGDLLDPNRPRKKFDKNKKSTCRERASYFSVKTIKGQVCIRESYAEYLGDKSTEGRYLILIIFLYTLIYPCSALLFTTPYCCERHEGFVLQNFLPGPIFTGNLQPGLLKRKVAERGRPMDNRALLDKRLIEWLEQVHESDPLRSVRPPHIILSPLHRQILVRKQPKHIRNATDITAILEQTDEWAEEWQEKVYQVIQQFDRDLESSKKLQKATKVRNPQTKKLKK
jgi:hypothetical protein